jgi:AAA family ATP:ADP antiporter
MLDRALRLFTDVRAGEGATALLLSFNVFLILTAYYLLRVLREPLILAGGGAEVKSYSSAGQAALLLVMVPAYGLLAARLPRRRLIVGVTSFFLACIAGFYILGRAGAAIGVPFFIWVGIFSLMVIAQFWSFANDVYTTDEGKRLFPIVAFGASAGAVAGSWLAGRLAEALGLMQLLPAAGVILLAAMLLTLLIDARERRREPALPALPSATASGTFPAATTQFRAASGEFRAVLASEAYAKESGQFPAVKPGAGPEEEVRAKGGSFMLVLKSPYLLPIALLILILNFVNTTGGYVLDRTIARAAAELVASGAADGRSEGEVIGGFFSGYLTVINLVGMLMQLFIVSRILKYLGVRVALLVLPVVAMAGYAILAFFPLLGAIRWAKTVENATDYSLQNTVRNVLFLPTTREEKYSAKQAIDGFFVRAGDLASAALVYAGAHWFMMQTMHFALVNLVMIAVWIGLAITIGRRYERLAAATA